ncbi:MAG: hypothetical protein SOZ28_03445 [Clostridia bacterium]|nr:hypothetical protein [Clostridia bacterium]
MNMSLEQSKEINEGAGKVGCWGVVAFLIFLILSIFSGGNVVFITLTILALIIPIICGFVQKAVEGPIEADRLRREEEERKKKKEDEEKRRQAEENIKIMTFYDQCKKEGIFNLDTEQSKQKASLIAKRIMLTHVYYTDAYVRGKALREEKDKEDRAEQIKQLKNEEHEKYIQLTKYSSFVGRDKKIRMLNDLIAPYKIELAKLQGQENKALDAFSTRPELKSESDPLIVGGIATGLAGSTAGVIAAIGSQQQNEKIRERNKMMTNLHAGMLESASKVAYYTNIQISSIKNEMKPIEEKLEAAKIKLIENSDEQELLDNLKFDNVTVKFSETGAFTITARASHKKNTIMFENTKAFIDGTVKANLYQNGKCVGNTFLVAPINGFYGELQGICLADSNTAKKDEPYEIKFEPYHLWKMEV